MIEQKARIRIIIIDTEIRKLELEKEEILLKQELTMKEHYEYYHG